MAHNKRGESKSMLSLPPPVGCGWVMAFSGGGKKHPKNRTLRTIFFHSFMSRFTTTPPPPQPMAFPMSLSDGSSRLMSHHSSCFMSHGSSCPRMTLVSCLTSHGVSCRTVHGSSWLLMGGGDLMSRGVGMSHHGSCLTERAVEKEKKTTESPPHHPPTHPHHAYPERRRRRRRSEEVRSANDLAGGKRAPLK